MPALPVMKMNEEPYFEVVLCSLYNIKIFNIIDVDVNILNYRPRVKSS